jgi:hypothetical protein
VLNDLNHRSKALELGLVQNSFEEGQTQVMESKDAVATKVAIASSVVIQRNIPQSQMNHYHHHHCSSRMSFFDLQIAHFICLILGKDLLAFTELSIVRRPIPPKFFLSLLCHQQDL